MSLLQIYQWVCQWKNFENRLTFGEVMGKSLVSCFFWGTVYRLCLLSHKCLHGLALTYLSQSCQPLSSVSRQSHTHQLHARPKILYNRRFGSFYCAAPTSWNTILHDPDLSVSDCTLILMTVVLPTVPVFTLLHQRAFVTVCLLIGVIEIAVYYYYYYLLCPM